MGASQCSCGAVGWGWMVLLAMIASCIFLMFVTRGRTPQDHWPDDENADSRPDTALPPVGSAASAKEIIDKPEVSGRSRTEGPSFPPPFLHERVHSSPTPRLAHISSTAALRAYCSGSKRGVHCRSRA